MATHTLVTGNCAVGGETSEVFSSVFYPLGSKTRDSAGNEYVFVDFGSSQVANGFQAGEFVVYDHAFLATRMTAASRGFVGIVMGALITATNRYAWVQVYGVNTFAWASTSVTTAAPVAAGVTTDLGALTIQSSTDTLVSLFNIIVRVDPNSCASTLLGTSALSAPCTVQLNYPFMAGFLGVSS